MPSITIRNIDDELKRILLEQAEQHGRTLQEEVQDILRRGIKNKVSSTVQTVRCRCLTFCPVEAPSPKSCVTSTLGETFKGKWPRRDISGWGTLPF